MFYIYMAIVVINTIFNIILIGMDNLSLISSVEIVDDQIILKLDQVKVRKIQI